MFSGTGLPTRGTTQIPEANTSDALRFRLGSDLESRRRPPDFSYPGSLWAEQTGLPVSVVAEHQFYRAVYPALRLFSAAIRK